MKLRKHYTRKDKSQWKYEIVLPKIEVSGAGFDDGDELDIFSNKGELILRKSKSKRIK